MIFHHLLMRFHHFLKLSRRHTTGTLFVGSGVGRRAGLLISGTPFPLGIFPILNILSLILPTLSSLQPFRKTLS